MNECGDPNPGNTYSIVKDRRYDYIVSCYHCIIAVNSTVREGLACLQCGSGTCLKCPDPFPDCPTNRPRKAEAGTRYNCKNQMPERQVRDLSHKPCGSDVRKGEGL